MIEELLSDALRRSIHYLEGARARRVSMLKLETPWDDDEDDDEDTPHRHDEDDDTEPDEDDPSEDDDEDDEEPLRVLR
ncbi:MAG TPA: hypothetical protein VGP97_04150 [Burkholderiales bacterium]|jgi:hypothetical protein|nr:hypothetical protein [Burkholderiales bacterium]